MNSVCVNTLDLRSPTGRPLADATPSKGDRLFGGCAEKNSAPRASGDTLCHNGVGRGGGGGRSNADLPPLASAGLDSTCSYMSRSFSKLVGKNISKYPCCTNSDEQGTIVFLYRVCTTGALYPTTVSGSEEKSDKRRRCRGKCVRSL